VSANVSIEWAAVTDIDLLRLRLAVDTELRNRDSHTPSVSRASERLLSTIGKRLVCRITACPTGPRTSTLYPRRGSLFNQDDLQWQEDRYSLPDTVCPEKQLFEYLLVVHLSTTGS